MSKVVAIVSGGSSGLGAAAASQILRQGGRVVVADLPASQDRFQDLVASHVEEGAVLASSSLVFAGTDVTNVDQISTALDLAETHFGEPVNAAISCAGVAPAKKTLSVKNGEVRVHAEDVFSHTLNVNVTGTFNLARLSAERMLARSTDNNGLRGCIVNTASISAYEGQIGQVAYSASKGAVVGMTLPMARDLAEHGIRVMTVAPGLFLTPLLEGLPQKVIDGMYVKSRKKHDYNVYPNGHSYFVPSSTFFDRTGRFRTVSVSVGRSTGVWRVGRFHLDEPHVEWIRHSTGWSTTHATITQ